MTEKYQGLVEKLKKMEKGNQEILAKRNTEKLPTMEERTIEKKRIETQFLSNINVLQEIAQNSRSTYSRSFAKAQLEYFQRIHQLINQFEKHDDTEVHLLHAEFSLDFATQTTLYALLSTLHAIDLAERKEQNERN